MLSELILENFILTERATFSFGPGFTVITGATGAGKSLFVKAMKLILGGRADTSVLRHGAGQAAVQALFEIPEEFRKTMLDHGIETGGELIIRRVIPAGGRGRIFVNGCLVTLQQLRRLTGGLAGIAGQHEFQNLLKREKHLEMMDEFGGLGQERSRLSRRYAETADLRKRLRNLTEKHAKWKDEKDRILREQQRIDEIKPKEHEEDDLLRQRAVLKSSSELRSLGEEAYQKLYSSRGSITEELSFCRGSVEKMADLDSNLGPLRQQIDSITYQAEDLAISLRDYLHSLPLDLSRLDRIEERLFKLQELKKRFGPEISDVLSYRRGLEERLAQFDGLEQEIGAAAKRLEAAEKRLCGEAKELSRKRKGLCRSMEQAVLKELSALNLKRAAFKVEIESPDDMVPEAVGLRGADQVEFLFSANPGQPLRPLVRVASGGELSRILLALKTITGGRDLEETLIFDEIDAGLGGEVAENVGKKLRKMGEDNQVIAITHFPQIAAMGQGHLVVEKREKDGGTVTEVRGISAEARLGEIVRMLGGETETAKRYAHELLGSVLRGT